MKELIAELKSMLYNSKNPKMDNSHQINFNDLNRLLTKIIIKSEELEKQIEACKKGSDDYLNLMEIEHLRKQNEELIEVLLLTLWRLVNDSGVTDTVFVSDREKEFETLYERIESVLKEAE